MCDHVFAIKTAMTAKIVTVYVCDLQMAELEVQWLRLAMLEAALF